MNFIKNISIITLATLMLSCGHNHKEGDVHDHGHDHSAHADSHGHNDHEHGAQEEEGGLHLSQEQAKTVGLKFGDFSSIKVNDYVKATGVLGLPANAHSSISAKASGIIRGTKKFVEGGYVKKGEVIAYLENPDFMTTQQEYLEIQAELALQRLEVDRQKTLVDGNAGIERDLQRAEAKARILSSTEPSIHVLVSTPSKYCCISTDSWRQYNALTKSATCR